MVAYVLLSAPALDGLAQTVEPIERVMIVPGNVALVAIASITDVAFESSLEPTLVEFAHVSPFV